MRIGNVALCRTMLEMCIISLFALPENGCVAHECRLVFMKAAGLEADTKILGLTPAGGIVVSSVTVGSPVAY